MPDASISTLPPTSGLSDNAPLMRARHGLDACVHCGFCLQACPTYLAVEDENDSPRGRLVLMRALVEGTIDSDDEVLHTHIDRCLGCRACETACPSGVPYGELLEATRATLVRDRPLSRAARAILWLFARPVWLAFAFAVARLMRATGLAEVLGHLPGRPGFGMAMLAASASPLKSDAKRRYAPAAGPAREQVAVLRGCVMHGLFASTNRATARTLAMNGYDIIDAPGQGCCGALHAHAGDETGARALARINVSAFSASGAGTIVSNAAGCGAMLKSYGHLLADDPAWADRAAAVSAASRDVSEVLTGAGGPKPPGSSAAPGAAGSAPDGAATGVATGAATGPTKGRTTGTTKGRATGTTTGRAAGDITVGDPAAHPADQRATTPWRVAYDDPCHLLHAQRIAQPPRAILAAIPWIEVVPLIDSDQCCGGAGIYNLLEPEISGSVLAAKLSQIRASGARWVATGNPGCIMQIGAGLRRGGHDIRVVHPVDLLDLAYALDDADTRTRQKAAQKTTSSTPPTART